MDILYGPDVSSYLLFLSYLSFIYLPTRIQLIAKNEHTQVSSLFTNIPLYSAVAIFVSFTLYLNISDGFGSFWDYFFIIMVAIVGFLALYTAYLRKFKQQEKVTMHKIYYGATNCEDAINQFNQLNNDAEIKKSVGLGPLNIVIQSNDDELRQMILTDLNTREDMMEDLNQKQYQTRKYIFSIIFGLSVIYMFGFLVYFFSNL